MLKLVITVVAIALPDCINPSLIGAELFVATGSHPRRRTVEFTLAVWTVTFVFGLAIALGLGDLILSLLPKPGATVKFALIAGAGTVLTIGGIAVLVGRRGLTNSRRERPRSHTSPAVIGAGTAALELVTAFPYFAAIALIVGSGVSLAGKLVLLVLYCVIYTLPLIAIAVVFAVMGDRADRAIRPAGDWLLAHWPVIVGPLTIAIGIAVLGFGIVELASV